jgi:very-short-patch-repair endonuclease
LLGWGPSFVDLDRSGVGEIDETRPEAPVLALAADQHGVVTTAQLLVAGWSRDVIAGRVRSGWVRPLHRGVYLVGPVETEHARAIAAVLAVPGSVLSHYPAAVVHGLRPARGGPMHLTVPRDARMRDGIRIHRAALHSADITRRHGIPVTSPARTILDLAGAEGLSEAELALNEARVQRRVSLASLNEQFSRYPRHRGTAALKEATQADAGFTRSKAERLMLRLIQRAELPRPQANTHVEGHEVDLVWPSQRLIVEFDGYATHSLRRSFEQDRRRDQHLVARGWRVIRVTWRQLNDQPEAVVATLATALAA